MGCGGGLIPTNEVPGSLMGSVGGPKRLSSVGCLARYERIALDRGLLRSTRFRSVSLGSSTEPMVLGGRLIGGRLGGLSGRARVLGDGEPCS